MPNRYTKNEAFIQLKQSFKSDKTGTPAQQAMAAVVKNTRMFSTYVVAPGSPHKVAPGPPPVWLRYNVTCRKYGNIEQPAINITKRTAKGTEKITLDALQITLAHYKEPKKKKPPIWVGFRGTIVVEGKDDVTVDDNNNCNFSTWESIWEKFGIDPGGTKNNNGRVDMFSCKSYAVAVLAEVAQGEWKQLAQHAVDTWEAASGVPQGDAALPSNSSRPRTNVAVRADTFTTPNSDQARYGATRSSLISPLTLPHGTDNGHHLRTVAVSAFAQSTCVL